MRFLFALLFLVTPFRSVAAAVVCLAADHGGAAACESGTAGTSGSHGTRALGSTSAPTPMHMAGADSGTELGDMPGCGAIGLCAATPASIVATVAPLPLERVTDGGLSTSLPQLGPGIRPAPPIHPPIA